MSYEPITNMRRYLGDPASLTRYHRALNLNRGVHFLRIRRSGFAWIIAVGAGSVLFLIFFITPESVVTFLYLLGAALQADI